MTELNEIWKPINGYEEHYEVSNLGRVRSIDRMIMKMGKLRPRKGVIKNLTPHYKNGYYSVLLKVQGVEKRLFIHRLVAIHFIPNPENKKEVNHKEGIKSKNTVEDLEWATPKENSNHAYDIGLNLSRHAVIAIKDTAIMEFKSKSECGKILGVCNSWIGRAVKEGFLVNGFNIYSLCA